MINPKVYEPKTRDRLKSFLKQELNQNYRFLSDYSLKIFKYNKYRILEAHENPKVRFSGDVAYIAKPGTTKEIQMNLKQVGAIIRTYSFFIYALRIYE